MSFGPNLHVWTLGRGSNGQWKLRHTTDSLEDAISWFEKLDASGRQVAICEGGAFLHEGKPAVGQVAFWWNASLNEYFTREPERRGVGWSEDFDTWVAYAYPEPGDAAEPEPSRAQFSAPVEVGDGGAVASPEARYVEAACDHCGRILPMNQLQRLTHDVETGHTSGSRTTYGHTSRQTTRISRRGVSFSNSSGSSSSSSHSGRTYYRSETLLLCDGCFADQDQADHPILTFFNRILGS